MRSVILSATKRGNDLRSDLVLRQVIRVDADRPPHHLLSTLPEQTVVLRIKLSDNTGIVVGMGGSLE